MLRLRVASAVVLIPLLVLVLLLGRHAVAVVVTLVAILSAYEVSHLLREAGYENERVLVGAIGVGAVAEAWLTPTLPAASVTAGILALGAGFTIVTATALMLPALVAFARPDPRIGSRVWIATAFGGLYVALVSFLVRVMNAAPALPGDATLARWLDAGQAWLLVMVLAVWAFDTAAYVFGSRWGRRRFLVHLSPSKTWTGVVGGTLGAVAVSAVTLWAVGQSPLGGLALGLLVSVAAQAGDLAESMLKRAAAAKDSGRLIPGHGGMLDRIDSLLFAAPAVYVYVVFLGALG